MAYGRHSSEFGGHSRGAGSEGREAREPRVGKRTRVPEVVTRVIRGEPGAALPDAGEWSERVGADVSQARIVRGPEAEQAASAIGAKAFTVGNRVFLGAGVESDDEVLRHELRHVAQQTGAVDVEPEDLELAEHDDESEREARGGGAVTRGKVKINRLAADADVAEPVVNIGDVAPPMPADGDGAADRDEDDDKESRNDLIEELWAMARVPRHAVEKLPDAKLRQVHDDISRRVQQGGKHKVKIGSHEVTFTADGGAVTSSTTKKQGGFFSKLGSVVKAGLSFASFIPGPVGAAARAVNAVVGVVKGIKNGDVFAALKSALGAVAGGAQVLGAKGVAAMASAGSKVLGGVKATFDAVKNRSLTAGLGGLAEIAAGAAGMANAAGDKLSGFARHMRETARFLGAAGKARRAIDAARRGQIGEAVATGLRAFGEAAGGELGKDLGKLGGQVGAVNAAYGAVKRGDYAAAAAGMAQLASTVVTDPGARETLKDIGTALGAAGALKAAYERGDWMAVAAYGAEIAGTLARGKVGDDVAGGARVLHAATALRDAVRRGDPDAIGAAAWTLWSTARSEVNAISERHAPAILPTGKNYGDLLAHVPPVPEMAEPGQMQPHPTVIIDPTIFVAPEPVPPPPPPAARPQPPPDPNVRRAQELLNYWSRRHNTDFGLVEDGIMGPHTEGAIRYFQTVTHRAPTGRLDDDTMRGLEYYRASTQSLEWVLADGRRVASEARQLIARIHAIHMGSDLFVAADKELGDLTTALEDEMKKPDSVADLQEKIDAVRTKHRALEATIDDRFAQNITIAELIKKGADVTLKALGKPFPQVYIPYFALTDGIRALANGADWETALVSAGIGGLRSYAEIHHKASILKAVSQAGTNACQRIIEEVGAIEAKNPPDLERQIEAVFERQAHEFVAEAVARMAFLPADKMDLEGITAVVKEAFKRLVTDGSRKWIAPLVQAFPRS